MRGTVVKMAGRGGSGMSSEDITIVLMFTILFIFLAFVIWIKER